MGREEGGMGTREKEEDVTWKKEEGEESGERKARKMRRRRNGVKETEEGVEVRRKEDDVRVRL